MTENVFYPAPTPADSLAACVTPFNTCGGVPLFSSSGGADAGDGQGLSHPLRSLMPHLLQSRTILVVEDSSSLRANLAAHLETLQHTVFMAENGRAALDFLRRYPGDIVISDVHMPIMNGIALREAMLANPELARIPFIAISVDQDPSIMRQLLPLNVSAYLTKPFAVEQLLIVANKVLQDSRQLWNMEFARQEAERSLTLGSVLSFLRALDARDGYTHAHSTAVGELAGRVARRLRLSRAEVERVEVVGKLHDLGKIGIPDRVLLLAGPLTAEEFQIIKTHPAIGAGILGSIPSLSGIARDVLAHHERLDGSGYPERLKGDAIPLAARIVGVVDTFHAMTSDRPYRAGYSVERTLETIQEGAGRLFCPDCAAALEGLITSTQGGECPVPPKI